MKIETLKKLVEKKINSVSSRVVWSNSEFEEFKKEILEFLDLFESDNYPTNMFATNNKPDDITLSFSDNILKGNYYDISVKKF